MTSTAQVLAIGVDVGGTSARLAAVNNHGEILATKRTPTSKTASGDRLLAWIRESIVGIKKELGPSAFAEMTVGIAVAGLVDRQTGTVIRSINLPFLNDWPLAHEAAHSLGTERVTVLTDAEAATWGEFSLWDRLSSRSSKRFVHLRIGTGIALGVIINGRFDDVEPGRTTHANLLVVDDSPSATVCRCGLRGCLETIASGSVLVARARELGLGENIETLDQAARDGERDAKEVIEQATGAISKAIERVIQRYDPEVICLGGGVIERMPSLAQSLQAAWLAQRAIDPRRTPPLEFARLGDNAGVIGAAMVSRFVASGSILGQGTA